MKNAFKFLLVFAVLLTGCAAPATQVPQPSLPSPSNAPSATDLPTPTTAPTLAPTASPTAAPAPAWVAFIGNDGNVRLVERNSGELRQVTEDGTPPGSFMDGQNLVQYSNLQASPDGALLAYRRDVGTPVDAGYSYTYEVWTYQLANGELRQMLANMTVLGMAWQPGTHWLAFGAPFDEGYFSTRGQVDASKAKGIWAINADSGENLELVPPQNGYSLGQPKWAPDGLSLAFEEIWGYEGSGYVAFFDLKTREYTALGEALGILDWSPDGERIAYDTLTYAAQGSERIYLRARAGGEAQQLSPDYEQGYAFWPRFSPSGELIAYLANLGDRDSLVYTLFVQPVAGGEPRQLGSFENGVYLSWLADESGLILSAGPVEMRQVFEVSLADGAVRVLADGDAPVVVP